MVGNNKNKTPSKTATRVPFGLLDFDGTILRDDRMVADSVCQALARHGYDLYHGSGMSDAGTPTARYGELCERIGFVQGTPMPVILSAIIPEIGYERPTRHDIMMMTHTYHLEMNRRMQANKERMFTLANRNVLELLREMTRLGCRFVVCTGNEPEVATIGLSVLDVKAYYGGEMLSSPKVFGTTDMILPEDNGYVKPDRGGDYKALLYKRALWTVAETTEDERLAPFAVGDSEDDLDAATMLGMPFVMVTKQGKLVPYDVDGKCVANPNGDKTRDLLEKMGLIL